MQTFLERLESDNLDPEIDSEYVEYLFDEIEDVLERLPWVPLEDYIDEVIDAAITCGFMFHRQPIGTC